MKIAEVHTLYASNCWSIPDMLRVAATSIDEEVAEGCSPTTALVAVQLADNGEVQVYGWGDTDDLRALGLLVRGQHRLLADMGGG